MGVKSVFETSSVLKIRQTIGHIIAQAVNGKYLTSAAWVQSQIVSCVASSGQVALEGDFPSYFGFPCHSSFHLKLCFSSVIRNWYNEPTCDQST
jgi:hypothetical protein